ncbi:hypothetical protein ACTPEM_22795, partial [Clostridioides difficile]
SEFVLKELEKMGFENINKGVAGTGIIVTIDSKKEGPVFAIRALKFHILFSDILEASIFLEKLGIILSKPFINCICLAFTSENPL